MVEQSKLGGVGARLGTYLEELREFFNSREVRYGSPEDLVAFAERVNAPGTFQDEMGSLVRSIFFRESENLGRAELLELVTVAVGGPEVDTAAEKMGTPVRQVFVFVNAALRQHRGIVSGELDASAEPQVTAGDILAASQGLKQWEEGVVAARSPEDGSYKDTAPEGSAPVNVEPSRGVPADGSGMLFKAISASEEDRGRYHEDVYVGQPRSNRWLVPAVVAGVIAVGLGGYSLKTLTSHSAATAGGASTGAAPMQPAGLIAGTCVNAPTAAISRATIQERARWARTLLDQKLYEAALPELREVARLDPGFPGINLDQADALMQLKRPEDARDAVDTQIALSECLAKLPSSSLDAYCSAEFSLSTVGGCRPQLARIRQSAELQAALVHLELGHRVGPDAAAAASSAAVLALDATTPAHSGAHARPPAPAMTSKHVTPLPPATEGDSARPVLPRSLATAKPATAPRPTGRKNSPDDSLVHGDGTDSALGAYSKPQ